MFSQPVFVPYLTAQYHAPTWKALVVGTSVDAQNKFSCVGLQWAPYVSTAIPRIIIELLRFKFMVKRA